MSGIKIELRGASRLMGMLALAAVAVCGPAPASASGVPSSPQDRQRFVSVTRSLERAPLDAGLKADREWALAWLTDAPDLSVTICADALGGMLKGKYRHSGEIILQNMFSMATFVIENPERANDPNAQQMAGLEGALAAYRSILKDKPEAKSAALERLLQTQSRGELPAFVEKAWSRCSAEK